MPDDRGLGFADPNHEGNSVRYRSGLPCVTPGCMNPAGTAWGPYWCFECNVKRIKRITEQLEDIAARFNERTTDA